MSQETLQINVQSNSQNDVHNMPPLPKTNSESENGESKMMKFLILLGCRALGVLIIIGMLAVLGMGFLFGWHTTLQMQERTFLAGQGYVGQYSAGEYKLNIYCTGSATSPYTIVGLSGLGIQDYGVAMGPVHNELKNDYRFVYIDRAGYALSEDTKEIQTVERIVSDYRQALLNANITPPYVLMPHSIGGVYATYWMSMYPNEIEGIIYLDGTPLTADMTFDDEVKSTRWDSMFVEIAQIGYSRLIQNDHIDRLPDSYSETQREISEILQAQSITTFARLSESDESNNNKKSTLKVLTKTDIPKIYICSVAGYQTKEEVKEYFEWPYNKSVSVEYTDERAEKLLQQAKSIRENEISPYIESLGNTELVCLPGDHLIFLQKPIELANIIREFLWNLDPEALPDLLHSDNNEGSNLEDLEMVYFMTHAINKEALSQDTLGWLEWYNSLPEGEQSNIDYIPSDLLEICGTTMEEILGSPEETTYTEDVENYSEVAESETDAWDEPSYG